MFQNPHQSTLLPAAELEAAGNDLDDNPVSENDDEELPPPETVTVCIGEDDENLDNSQNQDLFASDVDPLSVEQEPEPSSSKEDYLKFDPEVIVKVENSDGEDCVLERSDTNDPDDDGYRSASDEGISRQKANSNQMNSSLVETTTWEKEQFSAGENSIVDVGTSNKVVNQLANTEATSNKEIENCTYASSTQIVTSFPDDVIDQMGSVVISSRQNSRASKEWAKIRMHAVLTNGEFLSEENSIADGTQCQRINTVHRQQTCKEWANMQVHAALHPDDTSMIPNEITQSIDPLGVGLSETECVSVKLEEVQIPTPLSDQNGISFPEIAKSSFPRKSGSVHNSLSTCKIKTAVQVILTRCEEAERLVQFLECSEESFKRKKVVQNLLAIPQINSDKTNISEISLADVPNIYKVVKIPNVRLVKSPKTAEWQVTPLNKDILDKSPNDGVNISPTMCKSWDIEEEESTIVPSSQLGYFKKGAAFQPLRCTYCRMAFTTDASLNEHLQNCIVRIRHERYLCKLCGKNLGSKAGLKMHTAIHKRSPRFKCVKCGEQFFFSRHLREHSQTHATDEPYRCKICKHSFLTLKGLNIHASLKHSFSPDFQEVKSSKTNLDFIRSEDDGTFIPKLPGSEVELTVLQKRTVTFHESAPTPPLLIQSKESHISSTTIEKGLLTSLKNTEIHASLNLSHSEKLLYKNTVFKCEICDMEFETNLKLKAHQFIHEKQTSRMLKDNKKICKRNTQCPICAQVFSSKQYVQSHITIHKIIRPFTCQICNRVFKDFSRFKFHCNLHTGAKPYKCKLCDLTFHSPDSRRYHFLRKHKNNNLQKTTFSCDRCSQSFSSQQLLRVHNCPITGQNRPSYKKQISSSVKQNNLYMPFVWTFSKFLCEGRPFQCNVCSEILANYKTFEKHVQSLHSAEKPYRCTLCNSTVSSRDAMRLHMKRHCAKPKEGEPSRVLNSKSNKCNACDAVFYTDGDLKRHLEIFHLANVNEISKSNESINCEKHSASLVEHKQAPSQMPVAHFRKVKCGLCSARFTSARYLKRHQNRYHKELQCGPGKYECPFCSAKFSVYLKLTAHIVRFHEENKAQSRQKNEKFKCDQCYVAYSLRSSLRRHKISCHPTKNENPSALKCCVKFVCKLCGEPFDNKSSLVGHEQGCRRDITKEPSGFKALSKSQKLVCNICNVTYISQETLERHNRLFHKLKKKMTVNYHKKAYKCEQCNARMLSQRSLSKHVRFFHRKKVKTVPFDNSNVKTYKCSLCEAIFNTPNALQEHNIQKHERRLDALATKRTYDCNLCGAKYFWRRSLMRHNDMHHKGKKLSKYSVSSIASLSKSEVSIPSDKHLGHHSCSLCGKSFDFIKDLKDHMLVHTTQLSSFRCDICLQTCSTATGLKNHMYSHIGKGLRESDSVQKICAPPVSKDEANKREKPANQVWKCDICEKSFDDKVKLIRHKARHTDARPFPCEICGVAFREKYCLLLHARNRHRQNITLDVQTYKCNSCNKQFLRKGNLLRHHCKNRRILS